MLKNTATSGGCVTHSGLRMSVAGIGKTQPHPKAGDMQISGPEKNPLIWATASFLRQKRPSNTLPQEADFHLRKLTQRPCQEVMFEPPFLTCVFARCLCFCVPFDWLGCSFLWISPAIVPNPLVFPSDQPAPKYVHTGRSSLFSPTNCSFRFPHVNPLFSHGDLGAGASRM